MPINYDEYLQASNGVGEAVRSNVVVARDIGNSQINVDTVLNWPNKFIATVGTLNATTGQLTPSTVTVFFGHLSGSYLIIDEFAPGYPDIGNAVNQIVVLKPTTSWADKIANRVALPAGGTIGQVLTKNSSTNGDASWQSGSGSSTAVFNETPAGTINGTNTTFTLASVPSNVALFLNGILQKPGAGNDYTISGATITMLTAPPTGSNLLANYLIASSLMIVGSNSLIQNETPSGLVNGTNTVFTTFRSYVGGSIEVYINGVRQKNGVHFTETTPGSGIFTMSDAPLTGDDIGVSYQYAASASFNADTVDGYHAFDLMPVGAGMDFWGSTLPSGNWLFAYGQAISRATYAQLFALLGTTYGVGDGSTTFNLPDKRGRVTAGKDDMGGTSANRLTNQSGGLDGDVLGANGGNEVHTLTRAQMPNINGTFTMHGAGAGGSTVLASVSGDFTDTGVSGQYRPGGSNTAGANSLYGASLNVGGNGAHNNVQPTLIANYIIKVL